MSDYTIKKLEGEFSIDEGEEDEEDDY
jgi:hypothetical protein